MTDFKKAVKRLLDKTLGIRIYSTRPHGRDDCHDLAASGVAFMTILDVGANDGASALKFHEAFPEATIHSFEPGAAAFSALTAACAKFPNIRTHKLALGSSSGEATLYLTAHSTMSSLIRPDSTTGEEHVIVTTLDAFTTEHGMTSVDLLKIDAEGYDLEVLRGASRLLDRGGVKFVLAEVGFHPDDERHVLFDDVRAYLMPLGFRVYGFYDQQLEWSGENRLRYANACFSHQSVHRRRM